MPDSPAGLKARSGDAVLMVGTTKGAFLKHEQPVDGSEGVILPSVSWG